MFVEIGNLNLGKGDPKLVVISTVNVSVFSICVLPPTSALNALDKSFETKDLESNVFCNSLFPTDINLTLL